MTGTSGTWLKLWTPIFDNPKVMMLSAEDKERWVFALLSAKKWDQNGVLPPLDYMALWCHKPIEWCKDAIERLVDRRLIDRLRGGDKEGRFGIHDWDEWQGNSDTSGAERQKRYRDRKREGRNVTPVTRNGLDLDLEKEEDLETEKEKESARNARTRSGDLFDQNQNRNQDDEDPLANPHFATIWKLYSEDFGDPRSPLDAAWEVFRKLGNEQQKDIALAVGLWRLVEGPARKANPEMRIKFLDTFIGKGHWKQFTIAAYPQFADAALRFVAKVLAGFAPIPNSGLDEAAERAQAPRLIEGSGR